MKVITLLLHFIFIAASSFGQTVDIPQSDIRILLENKNMIGILGNDCSRIDIHFNKAKKTDNFTYEINGASRTRLQIVCNFEGTIYIDSIAYLHSQKNEVEDIDGYILGEYCLIEDAKQLHSGLFSGFFKQAFRISKHGIDEPVNLIPVNKINLSEYVGTWQSGNSKPKVCNWADNIIPDTANDFCIFNDAGEWIVSPKYRKKGWENMYNAYFNEALSKDEVKAAENKEEENWWNHLNH